MSRKEGVKASRVDIIPSKEFGWCYVYKDNVCLGKVRWIEVDKNFGNVFEIRDGKLFQKEVNHE